MEIPMGDIINSYRQKLSDIIHTLTLKELHITQLEKKLTEKQEKIMDLQMKLDFYRITASGENLAEEPDDWKAPENGDHLDDRD
jgi:hypothetical protein